MASIRRLRSASGITATRCSTRGFAPRPVGAGRQPGHPPELTVEGREVVEAAIQRHCADGFVGAAEPHRRTMQARTQYVLTRRDADDLLENAQEVKQADSRFGSQIINFDACVRLRLD